MNQLLAFISCRVATMNPTPNKRNEGTLIAYMELLKVVVPYQIYTDAVISAKATTSTSSSPLCRTILM